MTRLLALILAVVVLASGCAQLPTSGPVEAIPPQDRAELNYEVRPRPPRPGMEPLLLVDGFLGAMTAGTGDYSIAREFLTERAAHDWRPNFGTMIYEADDQPKVQGDTVIMDTVVVGRLDARGSYSRSHDRLQWDFKLVKVGNDWRISNPPVGLMVKSLWFSTNFATMHLFFFDPTWQSLVPDVFYVPKSKRTPQFLINQLVQGPSEWLKPAVVTSLPRNSKIFVNSYSSSGLVEAQLNEELGGADQAARQLMAAQMAMTLSHNRPQTRSLSMALGPNKVMLPGSRSDGSMDVETFRRYMPTAAYASSSLFGIHETGVVTIVDKQGQGEVTPTVNVRIAEPPEALAVSLGADQLATVTGGAKKLWWSRMDPTKEPQLVGQRPGFLTPQFTRNGELWAIASTVSGTTVVRSVLGQPAVEVPADDLADVLVRTFRISPDGTRVVVGGTRAKKPFVAMLRIERGETVAVRGMRELDLGDTPQAPREVASVAWESTTSVVALAAARDSKVVHPWAFDIHGAVVEPRATLTWEARAISASPYNRPAGGTTPMVVFGGGQAWRYTVPMADRRTGDGASWLSYVKDISFVCYPG